MRALRARGDDVLFGAESLSGMDDPDVLARATAESRVLITLDRDFGDLVFQREQAAPNGIIYIRAKGSSDEEFGAQLIAYLTENEAEIAECLTVIEPDEIRRRPIGSPLA